MTILLFNNQIYGLTKGQYSPTSQPGKVTKSTPAGSVDTPFNPTSLALGAEATFVARTLDSDRKHLTSVLRQAVQHRGAALVEIYQNCPIFNDGAFDVLKDRDEAATRLIRLEHGQPIQFGPNQEHAVVRGRDGALQVTNLNGASDEERAAVLVHDAHDPNPATQFALSRLDESSLSHVPIGVLRSVSRPTYDDLVRAQVDDAIAANGGPATDDDLAALLAGTDTWSVDNG
jgi:2-oxoglutarate ferredoxin oxidoreductase subunit beta